VNRKSTSSAFIQDVRLIIGGCNSDAESRCTCEVIRHLIQENLCAIAKVAYAAQSRLIKDLRTADYFVAVLTKGLLWDRVFSEVLLNIEQVRQPDPVELRTVLADTNFEFPGPEFYLQLENEGEQTAKLASGLKRLLKVLALPFSPHGSFSVISAQINEICKRLHRCEETEHRYATEEDKPLRHFNTMVVKNIRVQDLDDDSSFGDAANDNRANETLGLYSFCSSDHGARLTEVDIDFDDPDLPRCDIDRNTLQASLSSWPLENDMVMSEKSSGVPYLRTAEESLDLSKAQKQPSETGQT